MFPYQCFLGKEDAAVQKVCYGAGSSDRPEHPHENVGNCDVGVTIISKLHTLLTTLVPCFFAALNFQD